MRPPLARIFQLFAAFNKKLRSLFRKVEAKPKNEPKRSTVGQRIDAVGSLPLVVRRFVRRFGVRPRAEHAQDRRRHHRLRHRHRHPGANVIKLFFVRNLWIFKLRTKKFCNIGP